MNKMKNKSKAPKNQGIKRNGFFRALFMGVFVCLVSWIILSLLFALVMSNMEDSHAFGHVFSMIIPASSLFLGGFAAGRADKSCAILTSLLLGCVFLGICYVMSSALSLSKGMGGVMKSVTIIIMLVLPLLGARFSARNRSVKRRNGKRL